MIVCVFCLGSASFRPLSICLSNILCSDTQSINTTEFPIKLFLFTRFSVSVVSQWNILINSHLQAISRLLLSTAKIRILCNLTKSPNTQDKDNGCASILAIFEMITKREKGRHTFTSISSAVREVCLQRDCPMSH